MKKNFDIAIIDSGLFTDHKDINYCKYEGIHCYYEKNKFVCDQNYIDEIGHGSAIYHIIRRENKDAKILVVKVFEKNMECQVKLLIDTFNYLRKNYNIKILNISSGVVCCDNICEFENACTEIYNSGTILVAGFSNSGGISYPAAFKDVIGVDMTLSCKHKSTYEYVEGSVINVRAFGVTQRVPWLNNDYARVSGTSFSCPYITTYIFRQCICKNIFALEEIKNLLKQNAIKTYMLDSVDEKTTCFAIKKAIVFPFSKEIHSLLRYTELEDFEIVGVYDIKHLGNCGKKVIETQQHINNDMYIENYLAIDWNSEFDTLILGHMREIQAITTSDIRGYLVAQCQKYNKKIFSFDDMQVAYKNEYLKGNIYTPLIQKNNLPKNRFGKLYKIGKPIICVTGTSVKQGKFTLQLELRKKFLSAGYRVGGLGTEPTSELFGMERVYPMGYDHTTYLEGNDEITMINYMLHQMERHNDLIIVGSQSQTVAYECDNLRYIPLPQNNLMYACDADGYILVCNYFDEDDYIMKNILFLRHFSYPENNIVAIVIFPEEKDLQWTTLTGKKKFVEYDIAKQRAKELEKKVNIPVYVLGNENEEIYKETVKFLSE